MGGDEERYDETTDKVNSGGSDSENQMHTLLSTAPVCQSFFGLRLATSAQDSSKLTNTRPLQSHGGRGSLIVNHLTLRTSALEALCTPRQFILTAQ